MITDELMADLHEAGKLTDPGEELLAAILAVMRQSMRDGHPCPCCGSAPPL